MTHSQSPVSILNCPDCCNVAYCLSGQTRSNRELPSPISPVFLYLTHPYAFRLLHNFLRHVCRFRAFLRRLTAKGDNARMVKDVLSDIVDNSEIDLEALEKVSHDISAAIKQFIGLFFDEVRNCPKVLMIGISIRTEHGPYNEVYRNSDAANTMFRTTP